MQNVTRRSFVKNAGLAAMGVTTLSAIAGPALAEQAEQTAPA